MKKKDSNKNSWWSICLVKIVLSISKRLVNKATGNDSCSQHWCSLCCFWSSFLPSSLTIIELLSNKCHCNTFFVLNLSWTHYNMYKEKSVWQMRWGYSKGQESTGDISPNVLDHYSTVKISMVQKLSIASSDHVSVHEWQNYHLLMLPMAVSIKALIRENAVIVTSFLLNLPKSLSFLLKNRSEYGGFLTWELWIKHCQPVSCFRVVGQNDLRL